MARPVKNGLNYFPMDSDFFSSREMRCIIRNFGNMGSSFYFYLFTEIFRENGYYTVYDDDFLYNAQWSCNIDIKDIKKMVKFLLDNNFFSKEIFDDQSILTNESVQMTYAAAVRCKGKHRRIVVPKEYWLLSQDDTPDYIEIRGINSEETPVISEETPIILEETPVTDKKSVHNATNKSKVNKIKVNESKVQNFGTHAHVTLLQTDFDNLTCRYGERAVADCITRLDNYIEAKGCVPYNNHLSTLEKWLREDGFKPKEEHSYDLNKLLEHAMNHVPVLKT